MISVPDLVIRASAGSGKTFQLSNRYIELMASGVPADQILATTFTRKAAGEILERIVVRLAQSALSDRAARQLADSLGRDMARDDCMLLLRKLLTQIHRLSIGTLDSFFSRIASTFCLELGLPPGWRIVEEPRDEQLRSLAVESILQGNSTAEVSRLVNLLTKGDAERSVSQLVRSTVTRLYDLYQQTDAEAWHRFPATRPLNDRELRDLVEELRRIPLPGKRFETARENDVQCAEEGDWETFLAKGIPAKLLAGETLYYRAEIPTDVRDVYLRLIDHARDVLIDQLSKQTSATFELLEKFDTVYQELKYDAKAMRFDDVTRRLHDLSDVGDIENLEFRLDCRINHLLFDEFQDTSMTQWRVIHPLARRVTTTDEDNPLFGDECSFLCVGDVKQAIYGWRGGKSEIFDALEANLHGLTRRSLDRSYRSAPPVIETVNRLFRNLTAHPNLEKMRPAVEDYGRGFPEHTTARADLDGFTCLLAAAEAATGERQADVTLEYAAQRVEELVRTAPGSSVGVLTRRNSTVARMIYLLRRRNVRASEEGGNPLSDSVAVQLILSLLLLADHPGNTVARHHVAHSPLGEAVGLRPDASDRDAEQLAAAVRRELLSRGYGATIHAWSRRLDEYCGRRDSSRLHQLVELAFDYQSLSTLRPGDFVRYVTTRRISDPMSADVRVMTIHQAKGLQFDIVVLPELDDQLARQADACVVGQSDPTLPIDRVCMHRNSAIQSILPDDLRKLFQDAVYQQTTEAMCVLYVAITRAIHALYMIVSPSSPREKNLHKSYAGLIRAALTDGGPAAAETVLMRCGNENWHVGPSGRAATGGVPADVGEPDAEVPPRIELAPIGSGRRHGLARTSPSALEGGSRLTIDTLVRIGNQSALDRGTLIHAWFEQIEWLDEDRDGAQGAGWDERRLRQVAQELEIGDTDVEETLREFARFLEQPEVASLLDRRRYRETLPNRITARLPDGPSTETWSLRVENERRFAVHASGGILTGTIDRLVLFESDGRVVAADVIDYKTDSLSPDRPNEIARAVEHYAPQLRAYRAAVSRMYGLEPECVSTRLLLLAVDRVHEVGEH